MDKITKQEVLDILERYKTRFENEYGILKLGIFGSVAREENTEESDVDVIIKMRKPNLVTMSHIRIDLEEMMHKHVDIVHYREEMNEFLKQRIERDVVYVR